MRRIPLLHAWWFAIGSALVVLALNAALDAATGGPGGDVLGLCYFAAYGLYCAQNFRGCREYHCAITGPGFLLAAVLMLLRITGVFDHGFGLPYLWFVLTSALGHALEWRHWRRTGERALGVATRRV